MNQFDKSLTDYYWNHPHARPFYHPKIRKGRKVKSLISWAEYQRWEHVLMRTSPLEWTYRGSQIIGGHGDRFVILASDQKKFDEFLESELLHLGQTPKEMLEYDATGRHGEASQRIAVEKLGLLKEPWFKNNPAQERTYADCVLQDEFRYSRQELDSLSEEQKWALCRKETEARFGTKVSHKSDFPSPTGECQL